MSENNCKPSCWPYTYWGWVGWGPGWGCCGAGPATSNCPPSPTPPWSRQQVGFTQTLVEAGNVSLTCNVTLLDRVIGSPTPAPQAITIPDGNANGQTKTIAIPGGRLANTETWTLSGSFAGFSQLVFDGVGWNATLMWLDGSWGLVAGNAGITP